MFSFWCFLYQETMRKRAFNILQSRYTKSDISIYITVVTCLELSQSQDISRTWLEDWISFSLCGLLGLAGVMHVRKVMAPQMKFLVVKVQTWGSQSYWYEHVWNMMKWVKSQLTTPNNSYLKCYFKIDQALGHPRKSWILMWVHTRIKLSASPQFATNQSICLHQTSSNLVMQCGAYQWDQCVKLRPPIHQIWPSGEH